MERLLHIMRHAQAEESSSNQHDRDRELTAKGQREAMMMGTLLNQQQKKIELIFTSSAVRTTQTGKLVAEILKLEEQNLISETELYNSSIRTYLGFINAMDDNLATVMIIGHNPTVSYLVEYLSDAEIGSMPTAGIATLKISTDSWKHVSKASARLQSYKSPNTLND